MKGLTFSLFITMALFANSQCDQYDAAVLAEEMDDFDKSIALFEECIELECKVDDSYTRVYTITELIGRKEKADALIRSGLEYNENNQSLITALIEAHHSRLELDKAGEFLVLQLEKHPESYEIPYGIAVIAELKGSFGHAELSFKEADIRKMKLTNERHFEAMYGLAVLYFNQGARKHQAQSRASDPAVKVEHQKSAEKYFKLSKRICQEIDESVKPNDKATLWVWKQGCVASGEREKADELTARIKHLE